MKHIHVELGKDSYDIHIENGLLDRAGDYIRSLTKSKTLAVITDSLWKAPGKFPADGRLSGPSLGISGWRRT